MTKTLLNSLSIAALTLVATQALADIYDRYNRAVKDAAIVGDSEIVDDLEALIPGNPNLIWSEDGSKILVATWKSANAYEKYLKPYTETSSNPEYGLWVTPAPQVQNFCQTIAPEDMDKPKKFSNKVNRRLKQYLGLSPDWEYDLFVEMWISPEDLFRPCVDPEVTDASCELHFGDNIPTVKNIPDYKEFYEDLYYKSFRRSSGVPWTGLGYTFDWGNPDSEVGGSEYITVPKAKYQIERAIPTVEYCSAG
ncbi:MAG: hypothetical protein ACPGYX_10140 [Oceanobacter sp.]